MSKLIVIQAALQCIRRI